MNLCWTLEHTKVLYIKMSWTYKQENISPDQVFFNSYHLYPFVKSFSFDKFLAFIGIYFTLDCVTRWLLGDPMVMTFSQFMELPGLETEFNSFINIHHSAVPKREKNNGVEIDMELLHSSSEFSKHCSTWSLSFPRRDTLPNEVITHALNASSNA